MAIQSCRKCGATTRLPLAPCGYCYQCLSRFGAGTQVALLALAFNPSLTAVELKRLLGIESASLAQMLWDGVQALLAEQPFENSLELEDRRIHTRNSVIFRTVYLSRPRASVGEVQLHDGRVPVYLVEGTDFFEWATDKHDALYLGNVYRRKEARNK